MRHYGNHLPHLYLKPGEMCLTREPTVITTLLGSCVAVTMFHPHHRAGAICHGLLPTCRDADAVCCTRNCQLGYRYMDCAIQRMLEQFRAFGMKPVGMEVKMFGGADMFGLNSVTGTRLTVGRQNIAVARRMLKQARMVVHSEDVGGGSGRKILFRTDTGEILLKRLKGRL